MKMIMAVLDDSWYIFDNIIEILWQSMTFIFVHIQCLAITILCMKSFLSKSLTTLLTSKKCTRLSFLKHQKMTCTMYIPIKDVKGQSNYTIKT